MIAAQVALIIVGSLASFQVPGADVGGDKLGHAAVYAVLALSLTGITPPRRLWLVLAACFLLGASLEVAQGLWSPTRHADWLDLLANATGIAFAWLCVRNRRSGWSSWVLAWLQRR